MDQNISKNYVVDVGDSDAIAEAINKQKVICHISTTIFYGSLNWQFDFVTKIMDFQHLQEVVRELDLRKPQLDDLIVMSEALKNDTNRQKLQGRGMFLAILTDILT